MTINSNFPQETIRHKRDGEVLADAEIEDFIRGVADESICDGQVAAFAMAVFHNGMNQRECATLTRAMTESGDKIDWFALGLDGAIVDKHSTGGVGDKVSLVLAPIVAACGAYVPMISGRGLGHTGGTLDKLDCITGYNSRPSLERFIQVVQRVGCAIIGPTVNLVPADKRMYAIRDVTATIESIPLITASILSKKLAEGLNALVMDVKFGNGAFMSEYEDAKMLAQNIAAVAGECGMPTRCLLTDMNQVLGTHVGNALEVQSVVDMLRGTVSDTRFRTLTLSLAAEMLLLAGIVDDTKDGLSKAASALDSGLAADTFDRMVSELGGPIDFIANSRSYLPTAPIIKPVTALQSGFVVGMDTRMLGLAVMALGGGRMRYDQTIDAAVGLSDVCQVGDPMSRGGLLATVHARTEASAHTAIGTIRNAINISDQPPSRRDIIRECISSDSMVANDPPFIE